MAGSEKCVWWDFECNFPQWPERQQQSVSVSKHDGDGFPKISDGETREETLLKIANFLGVSRRHLSWWKSPWGVDDLVISQKPSLKEFESYEDALRLSCDIYNLCQFTRSEQIERWNKVKENIKRKMTERGYK